MLERAFPFSRLIDWDHQEITWKRARQLALEVKALLDAGRTAKDDYFRVVENLERSERVLIRYLCDAALLHATHLHSQTAGRILQLSIESKDRNLYERLLARSVELDDGRSLAMTMHLAKLYSPPYPARLKSLLRAWLAHATRLAKAPRVQERDLLLWSLVSVSAALGDNPSLLASLERVAREEDFDPEAWGLDEVLARVRDRRVRAFLKLHSR